MAETIAVIERAVGGRWRFTWRVGHDVRLWARDGACGGDGCTPRQSALPVRKSLARSGHAVVAPAGGAAGCPVGRVCRAFAWTARCGSRRRPVVAAKRRARQRHQGLETDSLQRMSTVLAEEASAAQPVVVLSGPSFAAEVAQGLPTALLSASSHAAAAAACRNGLRVRRSGFYVSDDVPVLRLAGR